MAKPNAVQSQFSRLTSIGLRGGFVVIAAAGLYISDFTFLGDTILPYLIATSFPVLLVGVATATSEASTVSSRRGSPEEGTLEVGSDDASTAGGAEVPVELFGSGSASDWAWAAGIVLALSNTLAFYDYSGTTLAFLTAFPFILMLALDQA